MITSRKELSFYKQADRMMNRGEFTPSFQTRLKQILFKDKIIDYLVSMRKYAFYKNTPPSSSCLRQFTSLRSAFIERDLNVWVLD